MKMLHTVLEDIMSADLSSEQKETVVEATVILSSSKKLSKDKSGSLVRRDYSPSS